MNTAPRRTETDLNATLFARKATGLVRQWSLVDAMLYSYIACMFVILGIYIFVFAPSIPHAQLIPAIVISAIFLVFEIVVWSMLISIVPRAGGDYVWQTRILGGGLGSVVTLVGFVLILWLWTPVYGTTAVDAIIAPLLVTLAAITKANAFMAAATWFASANGNFVASLLMIAMPFTAIALGMRAIAKVQKVAFIIGTLGFLTMLGLFAGSNPAHFAQVFNVFSNHVFGTSGDVYKVVIAASTKAGYNPLPFGALPLVASLPLIPLVSFYDLWFNFGSTLYGEVRGAGEFRRNFWGMTLALIITTVSGLLVLWLVAKGIGWNFYNDLNFLQGAGKSPIPVFPWPTIFGVALTQSTLLRLWLVLSFGAWIIAFGLPLFLTSTRVLFAAGFDRVLPAWVSEVTPGRGTPLNALYCMAIPSIIVSALYFYYPPFATLTLDATAAIALAYLGTTIVAAIWPWKEKEVYQASPVSRYKILGVPAITVAAVVYGVFLVYNLYMWITNPIYGVNSPISGIFMLILYVIAIIFFAWSRYSNKKQGIDLSVIHKNIPVE